MNRIKVFVKTSVLGGLAVILPAVLLMLLFRWLFNWIADIVQPLTNIIIAKGQFREVVADVIAIAIILLICFGVGVFVKTRAGRFVHKNLEGRILQLAPGYPTLKSVVMQFIGREASPFSTVALVQPFESETLLTAFITDTHPDGRRTVFVPTGPNPTSGFIFHMQPERVHPVEVSIEEVLKSVISCGAGSAKIMAAYNSSAS